MSVHIHWTEPHEEVLRRLERDDQWCFSCRSPQRFDRVVMAPIQPDDPEDWSYYGPYTEIRCCHCGTLDGDCFPGTSREWEDAS